MEEAKKLEWNNVSVFSIKNKEKRHVLRCVSGHAESGKMLAVMGESGSGKTTLINMIAGHLDINFKTNGVVTLNGAERNYNFHKLVSFVEQNEVFVPYYSVNEQLLCNSMAQNREMDLQRLNEKIDCVLKKLSLKKIKDRRIDKISGGELKRMQVAGCILSNKPIMILDEPTSGLDSKLALELVHFLHKIAEKENRMIIITIHQPSKSIMSFIDDILFIKKSRMLYFGKYADVKEFFTTKNFIIPKKVTLTEFLYFIGDKSIRNDRSAIANRLAFERYYENLVVDETYKETSCKSILRYINIFNTGMVCKLMKREFLIRLRYKSYSFLFKNFIFIVLYLGMVAASLKINDFKNQQLKKIGLEFDLINEKHQSIFGIIVSFLSIISISFINDSMVEKETRIKEVRKGNYSLFESFSALAIFNIIQTLFISTLMLVLTQLIFKLGVLKIIGWSALSTIPIFVQNIFVSTLIEIGVLSNLYIMAASLINSTLIMEFYPILVEKAKVFVNIIYFYLHLHPINAIPIFFYHVNNNKDLKAADNTTVPSVLKKSTEIFLSSPDRFLKENDITFSFFFLAYVIFITIIFLISIGLIVYRFSTYERLKLEKKSV